MIPNPPTADGQPPPDTRTPLGTSLTALMLTLVLGLGATGFVFRYVTHEDEKHVQSYVENAASSIATATSQNTFTQPVFDALTNVFGSIQQDVASGVKMTKSQLRGYLWEQPIQGMETTSIEFLPRVTAADLKNRDNARELLGAGERSTMPIVEQKSGGISRAAARDEYFPVLMEASYGADQEPIGLDRSNQPDFQLAMLQARDSGMMTVHSHFPASNSPTEYFESVYYYPLYRSGKAPGSIAERREQFIGMASAVSRYPAAAMYDFLPLSYHGIVATFTPEPAAAPPLNGLGTDIDQYLRQRDVKHAPYQVQGIDFGVVAAASPSLRESLFGNTRWWILGLGGLVNLWILSLLLWSRKQANKIVALINERTHDLTQTNAALSQSETRYRMLADNISDVIFTCDLNGCFTFISPSVRLLSGYSVDELLGAAFYSHLDQPSAELAQDIFVNVLKVLKQSGPKAALHEVREYELVCRNGNRKPVESTLNVLTGADGTAIGFVGVMRDISERKRVEKEKENLQQAWRQAQKMEAVGTLAGGIAHDFNNLLTGVLGHADMLKAENAQTPEALHSIQMIETAAIRAKELTSQLLGFARKGKFLQVSVDINPMLSDLVGLLERTVDKNIQITRISGAGNPAVLGDPSQINQVFLNLAINGRDAMPKGGNLTFKTEILTLDALSAETGLGMGAGEYCVVSVSDTGIGIAEDKLERIFEPFFTDKEEGKGTGLGLAMVYGVVKNHKGAVKVYSEVGSGSTFKIYLPLYSNSISERRKPLARTVVLGSGTVLLVDDQKLVRQVGEKMLKQLGYDVILRENGLEALDYYREHSQDIDVVMIDMMMPKMGGIECLDAMKKLNPGLKAILSTGFSREDIAEKIKESHILGFIQKPYRLQELSEVVAGVKRRDADAA